MSRRNRAEPQCRFCRRLPSQQRAGPDNKARDGRGTEGSNPTLGSFGRSKDARDSAILGDQINGFCPRFCPRRKAIKDPGWCGLDAPGQQFIHRPRSWLSQPTLAKDFENLAETLATFVTL